MVDARETLLRFLDKALAVKSERLCAFASKHKTHHKLAKHSGLAPLLDERLVQQLVHEDRVEPSSRAGGCHRGRIAMTQDSQGPLIDLAGKIALVTGAGAGNPLLVTPFLELGIGDFADRVFEVISI